MAIEKKIVLVYVRLNGVTRIALTK